MSQYQIFLVFGTDSSKIGSRFPVGTQYLFWKKLTIPNSLYLIHESILKIFNGTAFVYFNYNMNIVLFVILLIHDILNTVKYLFTRFFFISFSHIDSAYRKKHYHTYHGIIECYSLTDSYDTLDYS